MGQLAWKVPTALVPKVDTGFAEFTSAARLVPRCRHTVMADGTRTLMGLHTPIEPQRPAHPFGADILDLRHFSSQHLRPLLEHESQMWERKMAWDYRASAEMILRYIDSKILPGYAAVYDQRIGGYAFFVYEGSKGVIG